jgi:hypothetical protein
MRKAETHRGFGFFIFAVRARRTACFEIFNNRAMRLVRWPYKKNWDCLAFYLHCKLGPPFSAACWLVPAAQSACVLTKYNHI